MGGVMGLLLGRFSAWWLLCGVTLAAWSVRNALGLAILFMAIFL